MKRRASTIGAAIMATAALFLCHCHSTDLAACNSAKRRLSSQQRALAAQVAELQKQVAVLSETEQGGHALAVRALEAAQQAEASGRMPRELLGGYAAAVEALSRFQARFPKSEYAELVAEQLRIAKSRQGALQGESALVDAFDSAIASHDFGKAKAALGAVAPRLSPKSAEELQAKLEDASNTPLGITVRALLADPGTYSGKLLTLGPLAVESNEVPKRIFWACQSTGSAELDYDEEACLSVSYDRAGDPSRWRDLSADPIPRITVVGRAGTTDYGAPMLRAWRIEQER